MVIYSGYCTYMRYGLDSHLVFFCCDILLANFHHIFQGYDTYTGEIMPDETPLESTGKSPHESTDNLI